MINRKIAAFTRNNNKIHTHITVHKLSKIKGKKKIQQHPTWNKHQSLSSHEKHLKKQTKADINRKES